MALDIPTLLFYANICSRGCVESIFPLRKLKNEVASVDYIRCNKTTYFFLIYKVEISLTNSINWGKPSRATPEQEIILRIVILNLFQDLYF